MELLYCDRTLLVALKPHRVLSTDEPGGMPDLLRQALGEPSAIVHTVHRLDRVVGGVMVFARTKRAARELSAQIQARSFQKTYLAVTHGVPEPLAGQMEDLLWRNKVERKTYVVREPGVETQWAALNYVTLQQQQGMSLVRIALQTGRTHQIRAQFSSRGLPLVGDRKYAQSSKQVASCEIALWSHRVQFIHPKFGTAMDFCAPPPIQFPWHIFSPLQMELETGSICTKR